MRAFVQRAMKTVQMAVGVQPVPLGPTRNSKVLANALYVQQMKRLMQPGQCQILRVTKKSCPQTPALALVAVGI